MIMIYVRKIDHDHAFLGTYNRFKSAQSNMNTRPEFYLKVFLSWKKDALHRTIDISKRYLNGVIQTHLVTIPVNIRYR